jgi:CRISPR associated protein Cas2.
MKTYIITYDLVKDRDYKSLHEAIRNFSKWARITESTWAVVTNKKAAEIRDELRQVMDSDDRLFVVKSGVEAAWRNSKCKNEWLKENL